MSSDATKKCGAPMRVGPGLLWYAGLGLVLLCSSVSAASAQGAAAATPIPGTVRVVAEATVSVQPNQVEIDLGVVSQAKTASAAGADNAKKMEKIIAALKKQVGDQGDVRSVGYNISARYGHLTQRPDPNTPPSIIGYEASNTVRVRSYDVGAAGKLVDLALGAGANSMHSLEFSLRDPASVQGAALKAAAQRARERATTLASGLGAKIGAVISVSEGEGGPAPMPMLMRKREMMAADQSNTPIEAGALEVRAVVTATFALIR
jgi:uncharacterized protein